jgi:hypothetical protein
MSLKNERKITYFYTYIDLLEEKICLNLVSEFFYFWGPKTHFRAGRQENKGKRL